jgi:hypothetical protein
MSSSSENVDFLPSVEFARDHLAPRAALKPAFLKMLQETMALMFYDPKSSDCPESISAILDPRLRIKVANDANEALLSMGTVMPVSLASLGNGFGGGGDGFGGQQVQRKAKLRQLMRLKIALERWSKEDYGYDLPKGFDIGLGAMRARGSESAGSRGSGLSKNGNGINSGTLDEQRNDAMEL